jgi:hypothetical protein
MRLSVQESPASARETTHRCSLCGLVFRWDPEVGASACGRCPLGRGCGMVMCPNCGFEFPATSRVVNGLGRLLSRAVSRRRGRRA